LGQDTSGGAIINEVKKMTSKMKKQFSVLVLSGWVLVLVYSCGQKGRKVNLEADWSDPKAAVAVVEKYLTDIHAKDSGISRYDNATRTVFDLRPEEVLAAEVRQVSESSGEVGVRMKSNDVKVIIDLGVAWDTTVVGKDSVYGAFVVGGLSFRQVGDSIRYTWEKNGDFYKKVQPSPKVVQ
jgi:hypothetical protein